MKKKFDLPDDFDPEVYLLINEDVKAAGVDPKQHYMDFGRNEGRSYKTDCKKTHALNFLNSIKRKFGAHAKTKNPNPIYGLPSEQDITLHNNPKTKRPTIAKHDNIWEFVRSVGNKKGLRVLEIGSRSVVSDALWKRVIPDCKYTGFDVLEGKNVNVVGDAHRLSDYFEPNSFDLVISFAVFEHLAMPWIVAEEISKVLDIGGHVCIETHFSFSEHELPWHFFQFNSQALEVLFCPELGFEVIDSGLDTPIVGRFSHFAHESLRGNPVPDLYCHSSILARKTSATDAKSTSENFDWRKVAKRIYDESMYPKDSGML